MTNLHSAPISIAVAQTLPHAGNVAANTAEHLSLMRLAAGAGAHLLVFPELSLTGYELELGPELSFQAADLRLDPLAALATELRLTVIVGAPVKLGTELHIGAFIVPPSGESRVYTKQHLGAFPAEINPGGAVPPPEPSIFKPGTHDPLVDVNGKHGSVAICADTGRAAHAQAAADRGSALYLVSMFFTPGEVEQEHARLRSYAQRHALCVAAANYGGPTGGLPGGGHSAIWSPQGTLVSVLPGSGAGVAVAFEDGNAWRGEVLTLS